MTQKKKVTAQYSSLTGIHRAVPIILFAVAVFTLFCFITQDIGALGHAISGAFLGLFSYGAYAIPLLLGLHAIFYPSDISEKRVLSRVIFSLIAITFISALAYSITYWGEELTFNVADFFRNGQNSVGGGFIGSIVGFCIIKVFGRVGLIIIAIAIFAIYVSYFFASGQRSVSKVLYTLLKGIVIVLALIERGIKNLFRTLKNAKKEKIKRDAEQKKIELTDDEFFAVDNGMQRLSVSELGIKETRQEADLEANPTLHDKIFFKSAVSKEEAEEMAMREKAEEMFYYSAQKEDEEEDAPTPRRRLVNVTYDDPDSKIGRAPVKEEPVAEPIVTEPVTPVKDDSADSIFTQNFDPFSLVMAEQLASKPSSRSLLDETPRKKKVVTEDISEITEADIEREKQIQEFERRKAALLSARRAIPVDNDGEFKGTPKTVDFRERTDESINEAAVETEASSFTFEKTERTAAPPKAEPANYTAIGFGTDEAVNAMLSKPAFTVPETIYSYEPPTPEKKENEYRSSYSESSYSSSASYGARASEPIPASVPYVEEPEVTLFERKIPDKGYSVHVPVAESTPVRHESAPAVESAPERFDSAPAVDNTPTRYDSAPAVENTPTRYDSAPAVESEPIRIEPVFTPEPAPKYEAPFVMNPEPVEEKVEFSYTETKAPEEKVEFSYTATKSFEEEKTEEYVPEFKPYQVATPEEIAEPEVNTITIDEKPETEPIATLKIEREYVGDEYSEDEDDFTDGEDYSDDEIYDEELEEDDEEISDDDGMDMTLPEDDGDAYESDEIPEEERNPVVQGYKDMFSALRDEEPEDDEDDDHANDYQLTSPDEVEDNDDFDSDDDYDDPPFEHSSVRTEPKAKPEKKEEKPEKKKPDFSNFKLPPLDLLGFDPVVDDDTSEINENTKILIDTLASFGVTASIKGVDRGPRVTRYEVVPARGVKVNAITSLYNDICLNLAREGVRMEAPIPGKSAIGFEIPNRHPKNVRLRELLECDEFINAKSKTFAAIGKDVAGNPVFGDVAKYPHALICGATGMGKSVCINSIMVSMLYRVRPDEVKLIMVDPKKVEFKMYSGIPHLLIPVITESKQAAGALMWAVEEMERRYELIETHNVRNLDAYNEKVAANPSIGEKLPKIIIVIDELADLMMMVRDPVEDLIMRIAQKARAAGIHLIIGTQRPSVQVITGSIKANIPTRMSCKVTSQVDSRTVFDISGAEKLLNRGDMLYSTVDKPKAVRVQGAFVSDSEVENIMEFLKSQVPDSTYDEEVFAEINKAAQKCGNKKSGAGVSQDDIDDSSEECGYYSDQQFLDAVELAIRSKKVSTSLLQRKLSIGYGKAAKYIDAMEDIGIVSEPNGQKPRDVLLTMDEWHEKLSRVDFN